MKLKAVVDTIDEVEEAYRELYQSTVLGDKTVFVLQVDGFRTHPDALALSNAHNRTKESNRLLTAEVTELKEKLEDVPEDFDPALYERAKNNPTGTGEPANADQIREEAATAATKRAEDKAKKEIDKLTEQRDRFKSRAENMVKRAALDEALDAANVVDPALRKGARALMLPNLVVHEQDGELIALAKDAEVGDTLPVAEHVKAWAGTDEGKAYVSARESAGGGSNGGGNGGTPPSSEVNPWKQDSFNLTLQAKIKKEDPTKAATLMRAAGVAVPID